jgi:hypothetical protein
LVSAVVGFPAVAGAPFMLKSFVLLVFPQALQSLLLLACSDIPVGSCAAVDLAVSDVLTTVDVPRVTAEATALTVASFSTDVGSTRVPNVSVLPVVAVVAGSLLLFAPCCCWLLAVVDVSESHMVLLIYIHAIYLSFTF